MKMCLQIVIVGVNSSLETYCEEVSSHTWPDPIHGVQGIVVLLTVITMHATQMAKIIVYTKKMPLTKQNILICRRLHIQ